jgi:hypothetical protein
MPNVAVHSELSTIVANIAGVTILIVCYVFGVWLRNYIYPTDSTTPLKRQLMAAIPIGLVTMGVYAKTSFPGLDYSHDGVFDTAIMFGYAVVFGMLSRESLEKMLSAAGRNVPAAPTNGPQPNAGLAPPPNAPAV